MDGDLQYGTQNTFRNIEYHKQNHRREEPDQLADPLDYLWYSLDVQDEELIYSDSCLLLPPDIEPKNERLSG